MPLLTVTKKEENFMGITGVAGFMEFLEKTKQAMEVLIEGITFVCNMYDADFGDSEELYGADVFEELEVCIDFLLCDPPFNLRCYSELENTGHHIFRPHSVNDLFTISKTLVHPGGHGNFLFNASGSLVVAKNAVLQE